MKKYILSLVVAISATINDAILIVKEWFDDHDPPNTGSVMVDDKYIFYKSDNNKIE